MGKDGGYSKKNTIFNWAAKGLFFLTGGGGYTHSGWRKSGGGRGDLTLP